MHMFNSSTVWAFSCVFGSVMCCMLSWEKGVDCTQANLVSSLFYCEVMLLQNVASAQINSDIRENDVVCCFKPCMNLSALMEP